LEEKIMLWNHLGIRVLKAAAALAAMLFALTTSAHCSAAAGRSHQAFVKVNEFYFLYTYPVVPYLNAKGVLMVGLDGMGRGMNYYVHSGPQAQETDDYGHVTTDAAARTETLAFGDHTLTFTAGSATVQADGKSVSMEAEAAWNVPSGQMVVPALALAHCLHLAAHWDAKRRVLSLNGPDILTAPDGGGQMISRQGLAQYDTTSLVPNLVIFHPSGRPKDAVWASRPTHDTPWLMTEMTNTSRITVTQSLMNVFILYPDGEGSQNLDGFGEGKFNRGPDPVVVPPGGFRRFPIAMQTTYPTGLPPACVISCPIAVPALPARSSTSLSQFSKPAGSVASQGYIDPRVTGREHDVVVKAMAGLHPEDRENVIVVEPDGTVYANRPWLRSLFVTLRYIGGNRYQDKSGHIITLPAPEPKPTASTSITEGEAYMPNVANPSQPTTTSGPYIRLYTTPPASNSAPGFAYESASIYLPGVTPSSINVAENPNDDSSACVYMGGWSAGPNTDSLDVGFAHENAFSQYGGSKGNGWNDDWYPFWTSGLTNGFVNPKTQGATGDALRFKSNTNVVITFYVTSGQLNFVWRGTSYDYATHASLGVQSYSLVHSTGNFNWNQSGAGMILKSMTSIAQQGGPSGTNEGTASDFYDGSLIKGVTWSNCMLCRSGNITAPGAPQPQPWDSFSGNGNILFYPSNGSVSIASSGNSPNSNPNNTSGRTDSLVVP
jgi:hypothetical protein